MTVGDLKQILENVPDEYKLSVRIFGKIYDACTFQTEDVDVVSVTVDSGNKKVDFEY